MELCLEVVSVFFCAVYIVLLGQCYVAMPSGYKLVITRALGLHDIIILHSAGPRGWRPRASVQYIPYIPRARVITITYFPPTTLLPCSLVGFNCHKLAPQGYKGKYGS